METLFLELLNRSITAGWLVLAAVLIRLLFKRAPKWVTGCLWVLVAVRLLIPFSLESVYSLIPAAETVSTDILYSETPAIETGISVIDDTVNPQIGESLAPVPEYSANPMQIITAAASYLWIAGMILMFAYSAVTYVLLKHKVRTATKLRENIRQSERIKTPFVFGFLHPTVYLPYGVDETGVEYIIAHEKNHIRRGDHLVKPFAFTLLSVYWFNPFLWVAYILLCRDIELACDERVIENMSADERKAYSTVLLEFSTKQRLITACPVAFGEVGVKTRVKSVLNYRKPAFWMVVLALAVCVVCGVCLLTDPKPITGLPEAEEILGITMDSIPSNTEVSMEDDEKWLPVMLEMFGKATKTTRASYNDTPDETKLDSNTYLKITFHYADQTRSPSFETYYLYSQNGKAYLMRPYDAVYRFDDEFYGMLYDQYFVSLREYTQDVYLRINHEKMATEQELEQSEQDKTGLLEALRTEQERTKTTLQQVSSYIMLKASTQSSDYYHALFDSIYQGLTVHGHGKELRFKLPDIPELSYLNLLIIGESETDGIPQVDYYGASRNLDHSWESGIYPVSVPDGVTALTMYLSVESADGLCEVEYDLMKLLEPDLPSSEYHQNLFEDFCKSMRYSSKRHCLWYTFPDDPEITSWNVTTLLLSADGEVIENIHCSGDPDYRYVPGGLYSSAIGEDTVAMTMTISAETSDGLWTVEYNIRERFPQAFGQVPDTCTSCTALFAEIFESIYYGKGGISGEPMVFFRFPDVPEVETFSVTLTSTDTSGNTEPVPGCDGSGGFTAKSGRWYSVSIEEGTAAVTLHIVSDCTEVDTPCEVTFDLINWVN